MKNKKILVQVGGLISVVFAIGIIFITFIFVVTNTYTFLHEKNNSITDDIKNASYLMEVEGEENLY